MCVCVVCVHVCMCVCVCVHVCVCCVVLFCVVCVLCTVDEAAYSYLNVPVVDTKLQVQCCMCISIVDIIPYCTHSCHTIFCLGGGGGGILQTAFQDKT